MPRIDSPTDSSLDELCQQLSDWASELNRPGSWPLRQLQLCADYGVFRWFLAQEMGGAGWSTADVMRGYLKLSTACLTTTFVITQRTGACQRLAKSSNHSAQQAYLPGLIDGSIFATVGISHLTTSSRHLRKPALCAQPRGQGFVLDGFSPWVTGAPFADIVVVGAELDDGRQLLAALPTDLPGVSAAKTAQLVGLSASQTGPLRCDQVRIEPQHLLAGPVENVMRSGTGASTGGLQTSTLAVGLSRAGIEFMLEEADRRSELKEPAEALQAECLELEDDLIREAEGQSVCTLELIRTRANSLVLRATQAALAAAKGTGYVIGHPAGRWCQEALFFLVWSCPQPVVTANLCELAGIQSD